VLDLDHPSVNAGLGGVPVSDGATVPSEWAHQKRGGEGTTTEDAIAAGVFGDPAVWVDGDGVWGVDSFDHPNRHLDGTVSLSSEDVA
jgi:2-hydroxychromene-2-carboxylate isomerase